MVGDEKKKEELWSVRSDLLYKVERDEKFEFGFFVLCLGFLIFLCIDCFREEFLCVVSCFL